MRLRRRSLLPKWWKSQRSKKPLLLLKNPLLRLLRSPRSKSLLLRKTKRPLPKRLSSLKTSLPEEAEVKEATDAEDVVAVEAEAEETVVLKRTKTALLSRLVRNPEEAVAAEATTTEVVVTVPTEVTDVEVTNALTAVVEVKDVETVEAVERDAGEPRQDLLPLRLRRLRTPAPKLSGTSWTRKSE